MYVVPADHERFTRLAAAIGDALTSPDRHSPESGAAQRKAFTAARRRLGFE